MEDSEYVGEDYSIQLFQKMKITYIFTIYSKTHSVIGYITFALQHVEIYRNCNLYFFQISAYIESIFKIYSK